MGKTPLCKVTYDRKLLHTSSQAREHESVERRFNISLINKYIWLSNKARGRKGRCVFRWKGVLAFGCHSVLIALLLCLRTTCSSNIKRSISHYSSPHPIYVSCCFEIQISPKPTKLFSPFQHLSIIAIHCQKWHLQQG